MHNNILALLSIIAKDFFSLHEWSSGLLFKGRFDWSQVFENFDTSMYVRDDD